MILVLLCCLVVVTIQSISSDEKRVTYVKDLCNAAACDAKKGVFDISCHYYGTALGYYKRYGLNCADTLCKLWAGWGNTYRKQSLIHQNADKKTEEFASAIVDLSKALKCYTTAAEIYKNRAIKSNSDSLYGMILTGFGKIYGTRCLFHRKSKKGTQEFKDTKQDLGQALYALKKVCNRMRYVPAMKQFGILLTQCGKIEEADTELATWNESASDLNAVRTKIGVSFKNRWIKYGDDSDCTHALTWLEKSTKEKYPPAVEQRALVYMAAQEFPLAILGFMEAVRLAYNVGENLYNVGECRIAIKDYNGAIRAWQMAANLEGHADAMSALANLYEEQGRAQEAQLWRQKAKNYKNKKNDDA